MPRSVPPDAARVVGFEGGGYVVFIFFPALGGSGSHGTRVGGGGFLRAGGWGCGFRELWCGGACVGWGIGESGSVVLWLVGGWGGERGEGLRGGVDSTGLVVCWGYGYGYGYIYWIMVDTVFHIPIQFSIPSAKDVIVPVESCSNHMFSKRRRSMQSRIASYAAQNPLHCAVG